MPADVLPDLPAGPFHLRGFRPPDVALVRAAATDDYIPQVTTIPPHATEDEARGFVEDQRHRLADGYGYSFVIADAESDEGLGSIGLWLRDLDRGHGSTGYWVVPAARGQGVARHALQTLSRWGLRTLAIPRLHLHVEPWNAASIGVAESAGFVREGLLRSYLSVGGERRDLYVYSLIPEDLETAS